MPILDVGPTGETVTWDRDTTESQARQMWFPKPPGRTFVAVDADWQPADDR
jgi:hypothetical protein